MEGPIATWYARSTRGRLPAFVKTAAEIASWLRAGGSASIQDLRKNAPSHEIDAEIESMALDPLSALFTQLTFRFGLLRAAYKVEAIERLASRSRFGKAQILTNGIGFDLRLTKPEAMRRQL